MTYDKGEVIMKLRPVTGLSLIDLLKARLRHGDQAIPDPRKAVTDKAFPGFPTFDKSDKDIWNNAIENCPTGAIGEDGLDLGRCVFCGECQRKFPDTFVFTNSVKMGASDRKTLVLTGSQSPEEYAEKSIASSTDIRKLYGRSFKLRSVSAGGCGACELELNASTNVNFDINRYGIDIVASPRHADALVITGPITKNMAHALEETWNAIPAPKILILAGACAISGGLFSDSNTLNRSFLDKFESILYLPGCPVHPLTIVHGITSLLGRNK